MKKLYLNHSIFFVIFIKTVPIYSSNMHQYFDLKKLPSAGFYAFSLNVDAPKNEFIKAIYLLKNNTLSVYDCITILFASTITLKNYNVLHDNSLPAVLYEKIKKVADYYTDPNGTSVIIKPILNADIPYPAYIQFDYTINAYKLTINPTVLFNEPEDIQEWIIAHELAHVHCQHIKFTDEEFIIKELEADIYSYLHTPLNFYKTAQIYFKNLLSCVKNYLQAVGNEYTQENSYLFQKSYAPGHPLLEDRIATAKLIGKLRKAENTCNGNPPNTDWQTAYSSLS